MFKEYIFYVFFSFMFFLFVLCFNSDKASTAKKQESQVNVYSMAGACTIPTINFRRLNHS